MTTCDEVAKLDYHQQVNIVEYIINAKKGKGANSKFSFHYYSYMVH